MKKDIAVDIVFSLSAVEVIMVLDLTALTPSTPRLISDTILSISYPSLTLIYTDEITSSGLCFDKILIPRSSAELIRFLTVLPVV